MSLPNSQVNHVTDTIHANPALNGNSRSITDSPVCTDCESLLRQIAVYTTLPYDDAKYRYEYQSYGTINLGTTAAKAKECHMCALLLSVFHNGDIAKSNNENLEIQGEFFRSELSAILIKQKFLRVRRLGDWSSIHSTCIEELNWIRSPHRYSNLWPQSLERFWIIHLVTKSKKLGMPLAR